jgi:cell wall-associated NlpC family hydrolase
MNNTRSIAQPAVSLIALLLGACAANTPHPEPAPVSEHGVTAAVITTPGLAATDEPEVDVRTRILKHHATWHGTPHRWGGLTRKGVDCSGYIYHTYQDVFARALPRTTRAQARLGQGISREELRDGDLVFFKTGRNQRHVGIYVGDGQFAHASRSRGVIISSLDNVYWKRHYWQSRRLL